MTILPLLKFIVFSVPKLSGAYFQLILICADAAERQALSLLSD